MGAAAHATLATVKPTSPAMNTRLAAEAVAERAAEQQERRERDQVRVEDPLQTRRRRCADHCAIDGSATLTTVPSRKAMPDPSTVAAITQRPRAVPKRITVEVCPVRAVEQDDPRSGAAVDDRTIIEHITELVTEEQRLQEDARHDGKRLREVEISLDQMWDLLRQRRSRKEFGLDPDEAETRDPNTVERYLQ